MWCANCQDDVATEISRDGQSLKCTACGDVVREVFAPSLHPETKSARELLQKWADEQKQLGTSSGEDEDKSKVVDESTPAVSSDSHDESESPGEETISESVTAEESFPTFRVDEPHDTEYMRHGSRKSRSRRLIPRANEKTATADDDSQDEVFAEDFQFTEAVNRDKIKQHDSHGMPAPHFDMEFARRKARTRPGRAESIWGQLLAYLGVGVLTIGSVLVLWGYFGMIEQYASTGWLLSTAGQMLLLLGVVTLVSGGMQQTQHEVSERIEYLGGRMIRIENSTEQILNGPHFLKSKPNSDAVHAETAETEEEV